AQVGVALDDLERGQSLKRGGTGAKELERLPRKEVPVVRRPLVAVSLRVPVRVATAHGIADAPELIGLRDRQRAQHHLLNKRKNRGGGPNADRESQNRGHGQRGRLSQLAKRVTHAPPDSVNQLKCRAGPRTNTYSSSKCQRVTASAKFSECSS